MALTCILRVLLLIHRGIAVLYQYMLHTYFTLLSLFECSVTSPGTLYVSLHRLQAYLHPSASNGMIIRTNGVFSFGVTLLFANSVVNT